MEGPDGVIFIFPLFRQPRLYFTRRRDADQPLEKIADDIKLNVTRPYADPVMPARCRYFSPVPASLPVPSPGNLSGKYRGRRAE